jgi:hypothetical protein
VASPSAVAPAPWSPLRSPRRRVQALLALGDALAPSQRRRVRPDWADVTSVAVELWLAPSLWCAVAQEAGGIPAAPAELLHEHYRVNTLRNLRFRREYRDVVGALNGAGIVPLVLKGGASLMEATVRPVGERYMNDLDLAVPPEAVTDAVAALRPVGYLPLAAEGFLHPQEVTLVKRQAPGPVDLHVEIGVPPIPSILPLADAWAGSVELPTDGLQARALGPTDRVLHNILHASVQDLDHAVAGLPFRQLVTLTRLAGDLGPAVDWAAIRDLMTTHGLGPVLRDHLWLAHDLAGLELPAGTPRTTGARVHEARVVAGFGLGWPAHLQRNLRWAFEPAYLAERYGGTDRPLGLLRARLRHAVNLVRNQGLTAAREAVEPKV